jgi:hypothetical protein
MREVEAIIDDLRAGDIVAFNRRVRVVREVTRRRGRVSHVTFSILRCSWTRRPFTTRNRSDLYHVDLMILVRDYPIDATPLEALLYRDIMNTREKSVLQCCDVIGVLT